MKLPLTSRHYCLVMKTGSGPFKVMSDLDVNGVKKGPNAAWDEVSVVTRLGGLSSSGRGMSYASYDS